MRNCNLYPEIIEFLNNKQKRDSIKLQLLPNLASGMLGKHVNLTIPNEHEI